MANKWYEAGYNGSATTGKILKLHIYTVETNINENCTKERCDLWLSVTDTTGNYWNAYGSPVGMDIGGYSISDNVTFDARNIGDKLLIGTWDIIIYHNDEGKQTIGVSAYHNTDTVLGNASITDAYVCDVIPRASVISLSRTNMEFGQHSIIYTNSKSTEFTHNIFMYYNSDTPILVATDVTDNFLFDSSQYTQLYERIPNSKSGSGRFMLRTFKGEEIIGETWTDFTINLLVDDFKPIFEDFEYTADAETIELTGNSETIINGYTNIELIISSANKATPQKSATIVRYEIQIGSQKKSINYSEEDTSITIEDVDNKIINIYAIDSRGFSTQVSKEVTKFIEYSPIVISDSSIERNNGGIGTETTLSFNGNIWNDSFGIIQNSIESVKYQYKLTDSSEWIDGTTDITPTLDGNSFSFEGKIAGDMNALGFDTENSYEIKIIINDKLSTYIYPLNGSFILMSGKPAISIGKKGVSFGGPYDERVSGPLQIEGKRLLKKDVLYENSSGTTGTVTLSDSVENYKYIEIFYYRSSNDYGSIKIAKPNGKIGDIKIMFVAGGSTLQTGIKRISISGTNISTVYEYFINEVSTGTAAFLQTQNTIYIYKVIGYK